MIESRNINIIVDADGNRLVLINDIVFKGKRNVNWDEVKTYLEQYVGDYYEIEETSEKVYIGNKLPDEYTGSESKKILLGANAKAKANAATAIPELIQIAKNPSYQENKKEKHDKDAKHGWYRYDVRFAIPVYENEVLIRYNVFRARLLINHAENGKKYLYDILAIKKEKPTSLSFFSIATGLFSRYICCSRSFFCRLSFIFTAYIAFCHFDSIFIV